MSEGSKQKERQVAAQSRVAQTRVVFSRVLLSVKEGHVAAHGRVGRAYGLVCAKLARDFALGLPKSALRLLAL